MFELITRNTNKFSQGVVQPATLILTPTPACSFLLKYEEEDDD